MGRFVEYRKVGMHEAQHEMKGQVSKRNESEEIASKEIIVSKRNENNIQRK